MAHPHAPQFLALVESVRPQVNECNISDLKTKIEMSSGASNFYLVDVREDNEFAAGHIPGAIHIGKGVIERDIEAAISNPDAEIYLYCGGGFRSVLAADALKKMGYNNLTSVDGGWRGWVSAGYPTTK